MALDQAALTAPFFAQSPNSRGRHPARTFCARAEKSAIDLGDGDTAYRLVREAAPPTNLYYRAKLHFMAGWIALRFLADPATALAQYEAAARYPTAYYGQLARARLGLGEIALRRPPPEPVHGAARQLLRAADILYAIGERDLVASFATDLAEESSAAAALAALGQLTAHYNDARAMLLIGKAAARARLADGPVRFSRHRGAALQWIGPQLDRCIVYSIVRTESAFDQRDMSSAKAVGLMQVTPEAGRDTAKRFGAAYDWHRLVSDPVYNTQMGAAEVAALLKEYRGSYIMTFAGCNAGRGRVAQ